MSGDEVFTIQARRCKRYGRLLTSQEALARRLGVSEDTVRVMEYRGKNERYRRTKKGPMPGFGTRYKVRKVEVDG